MQDQGHHLHIGHPGPVQGQEARSRDRDFDHDDHKWMPPQFRRVRIAPPGLGRLRHARRGLRAAPKAGPRAQDSPAPIIMTDSNGSQPMTAQEAVL